MSVPRRAQWPKKVRARQHMTVPMARGHGLKKGLDMTQLKAGLTMFLLDEWMRPRTSRLIVRVNEAGTVGWLAANKDA